MRFLSGSQQGLCILLSCHPVRYNEKWRLEVSRPKRLPYAYNIKNEISKIGEIDKMKVEFHSKVIIDNKK